MDEITHDGLVKLAAAVRPAWFRNPQIRFTIIPCEWVKEGSVYRVDLKASRDSMHVHGVVQPTTVFGERADVWADIGYVIHPNDLASVRKSGLTDLDLHAAVEARWQEHLCSKKGTNGHR